MITFIVVAAIVAALVYALTRPDSFRVERSTAISAAPEKIFPLINDLRRWDAWSPWEKMDLAMKKTFSGAASGKGAVYGWEGNSKVGSGRMEITESVPSARIVIKLDFLKPFEAHNTAEFRLTADGGSTKVSWAMIGPMGFVQKLMSLFFNMDKLIGNDFAKGLANMKAAAEK